MYMTDNGTVCAAKRDGRSGGVQMITLTEKLTNLKYERLMASFDRDIQFLSSSYLVQKHDNT